MLKKLFFLMFFLFSPVGTHSLLLAQEEDVPILSFFHPPVSPETVFIPLNQSIPTEVLKTMSESMVAIRTTMPRMNGDQRIYKNHLFGGGFVVWPDYVVTSLHLFGEFPALWLGTNDFPTIVEISDGHAVFNASLADLNYSADLALLKVSSPNGWGAVFQPKPARLAKHVTIQDQSLSSPKTLHNKFYVFGFYTSDPHLYFALEVGPFRSITNSFDGGYLMDIPMGVLQRPAQSGFSGGPLLSPEGVVMGVVARTTENYTIVVLAETIDSFLTSARGKLGLDAEGKPAVPAEPETK